MSHMGLVGVLPSSEVIAAPLDPPLVVPEPEEPEEPELAPDASPPEYALWPAESPEHAATHETAARAARLAAALDGRADKEGETVIAGCRLYSGA
jgi:hypothetical protein